MDAKRLAFVAQSRSQLYLAWIHPFLSEDMVDPEVLTQLFKAVEKDRVEELVDLIGNNGVDINVCQRVCSKFTYESYFVNDCEILLFH